MFNAIKKIDKFLNLYTLLILNLAIIAVVEFTGNGRYFYDSGLIHLITVIFAFLVIYRVFTNYYIQDQFFKKFLNLSFISFAIFIATHIFEYLWMKFTPLNHEIMDIIVVGLYFIGLLFLIAGLEFILRVIQRKKDVSLRLPATILLLIAILSVISMAGYYQISKENIKLFLYAYLALYAYLVLIAISGIFAINTALKIKKFFPALKEFINYLALGIIFIIIASLFEFFELSGVLPIDSIQVVYLDHFAIYFALSFIFLGFGKLLNMGGVYEDVRKELEKENP